MGDSHSVSNKTLVIGCTVDFARLQVTVGVYDLWRFSKDFRSANV